jgi:hypothetical protein
MNARNLIEVEYMPAEEGSGLVVESDEIDMFL